MENSVPPRDHSVDMFTDIADVKVDFSMFCQWKLMSTLRAFGKSTLHRGWTARTSKGSAIRYVKGKATLWATQYMLRLRIHFASLSSELDGKILKAFPALLVHKCGG